ncbi:MAG: hypothetical protein ACNA8P_05355 [Phycisphaerales bacterium]
MPSSSLFRRFLRQPVLTLGACLGLVLMLPVAAAADEWLERAQRELGPVQGNLSAEQVLFPALINMDPFPIRSGTPGEFAAMPDYLFIPRNDPRRQRMIEWAGRPAQQAVLESIRTITDSSDNYIFSLQIGRDKVPSEWAEAGLYIEEGFDGLIGLANPEYLRVLGQRTLAVAYASAIAKAEAGNGDEALEDYAHFLILYRELLDRPIAADQEVGIAMMMVISRLMTDLVYQYTRPGDRSFTARGIADAILETDEQFLRVRQFLLPTVDHYAARQFFARAAGNGQRVDPNRFAAQMAMLHTDAGMNRFGFASAYRSLAPMQADRLDFERQYNDLVSDFNRRWSYTNLHDRLLRNRSVAQRMNAERYMILDAFIVDRIEHFFRLRLDLLTDLSGMRCALGVVAFHLDNRNLPGQIVAIQPRYVRSLNSNLDFVSYDERTNQSLPLRYWVPMRDEQFGPRETPTPYPIRVAFGSRGLPTSSAFARPATRERDLMQAIPFPGFGADSGIAAAGGDGGFSAGDFGSMIGFNAAQGQQAAMDLFTTGSVERFGLSDRDHAAFEQYLAGETDSMNFQAVRDAVKQQMRDDLPTERDAQQVSVALAGLQALGITLDGASAAVREQLRAFVEMASSADGGVDFADLDPADFADLDFGDDFDFADMQGMGDMGGMGGLAMLMGGDLDETLRNATGKSANEIIDYIAGVVDRLARIPSLREAVQNANRGEFLTANQLMQLSDDMVDALISPEVMNPMRDMLVHFRQSESAGQMLAAMPGASGGTTEVVFAIDSNSFLLYSVGRNGRDGRAAFIGSGNNGDNLYWPPTISLYRVYLNR